MQAADAAEQIQEVLEEERAERRQEERFRNIAALAIAVLAMLLAITSLGGGNVAEDMVHANIKASDTWAFYQAKNVRQTVNELTADLLEAQLGLHGAGAPTEAREEVQQKIARYRATAERYDSEPDPQAPNDPLKGEGKRELLIQAQKWEKQRDRAMEQDPNFDFAEVLLQIAIVLGSVAILAASRPVLCLSIGMGAAGTLLMLNGFFLFVKLPF